MPKEAVLAGATDYRIPLFVQDSTSSTGGGLTGLTHSTSGLSCAYWRSSDGNAGMTTVTLATATLGTWTSGGFVVKDATNGPGLYEFGVPNAAIASGAEWVVLYFFGATNMVPVRIELQLTGYDPNDGERLGLSSLPAGPMMVKKNQAYDFFTFPMTSSSSHQMQTGLTVTCQISKDGGSLANSTNAVVEIGGGLYYVSFVQAETDCGTMGLKFSASGADDLPYTLVTQP
jgi:hypothetical protein